MEHARPELVGPKSQSHIFLSRNGTRLTPSWAASAIFWASSGLTSRVAVRRTAVWVEVGSALRSMPSTRTPVRAGCGNLIFTVFRSGGSVILSSFSRRLIMLCARFAVDAPPRHVQPVRDVLLDLALLERQQLAAVGDALLELHELVVAPLDRFLFELPDFFGESERGRIFFQGVLENAHVLEPQLFEHLFHVQEAFLGLSWMTHDDIGAEYQARYPRAHFLHERVDLRASNSPVHELEHLIVAMLERHIYVFRDFGLGRDEINYLIGEVIRVGIMQPDPAELLDLHELPQEHRQIFAIVVFDSVVGEVLRYEIKLGYAAESEARSIAFRVPK